MTLLTRGQNISDLFLTLSPTFIDKTTVLPSSYDHDIVQVEFNVKSKITKQVPRDILLCKTAD